MGPLAHTVSCLEICQPQTDDHPIELEPTSLLVQGKEPLHLPRAGTAPCSLDCYLQNHPVLVETAQNLAKAQKPPPLHSRKRRNHSLTVLQGEVGYCTPDDADVLLSTQATTCHLVALRSKAINTTNCTPLTSLAHVDTVRSVDIREMVQTHLDFHHPPPFLSSDNKDNDDDEFGFFDHHDNDPLVEETKTNHFLPTYAPPKQSQSSPNLVELELHMVGGYDDPVSRDLTDQLLHEFDTVGRQLSHKLRISLSTAAVSALNTTDHGPRHRGLGIETHSGSIFGVNRDEDDPVPACTVRHARVWYSDKLATIHHPKTSQQLIIPPFNYERQEQLNVLLDVPDHVLLQHASTSPDLESAAFCHTFRRTLSFVNTVPPESCFPNNAPLIYQRQSCGGWIQQQPCQQRQSSSL